jgi:hypothetical protein
MAIDTARTTKNGVARLDIDRSKRRVMAQRIISQNKVHAS